MTIALKVEDVSKMYRLGLVGTGTLSHDLNRWWARLRGRPDPTFKVSVDNNRTESGGQYAWALKDVNLEVEQGEILGIIGRNGAGKSTLLKLLSRVTAPTKGVIKAKGRIASLLEVGTGFHPELTGRENVYLNGAILGMTRPEITRRLEEIVDFSGCAKYIDTPVKRYSSGMTVRLGFAVAAHLDCELLIIDEVLAVGDADFQRRCIGKIDGVAKSGRTVLIVSHQMTLISLLCSRAVILRNGSLAFSGDPKKAIDEYIREQMASEANGTGLADRHDRKGDGKARFTSVEICGREETPLSVAISGEPLVFRLRVDSHLDAADHVNIAIGVKGMDQQYVFHMGNTTIATPLAIRKGSNEITCSIPSLPLRAGHYQLNLYCETNGIIRDWVQDTGQFRVEEGDFYGTGQLPPGNTGTILVPFGFAIESN